MEKHNCYIYVLGVSALFLHTSLGNRGDSRLILKRNCRVKTIYNFTRFLESPCYMDKTMFIKDFMTNNQSVVLVSAPKRFGKKANLRVLKEFLQIENGNISSRLTESCKMFKYFNLSIYKYDNNAFFNSHCGKHPVLYVSLNVTKGFRFVEVLKTLTSKVRATFSQHKYLLTSPLLDQQDKEDILRYLNQTVPNENYIRNGLKVLSEKMYKHFNKSVVVLINDYDAVIWHSLKHYYKEADVSKAIDLVKTLTSTLLNSSDCVNRALLNSCSRLSSILIKNLRDTVHYGFLENHKFVQYYGFTSEEVKATLKKFNLMNRFNNIKTMYGGYHTEHSGVEMYNMWSFLNYLEQEKLKSFWLESVRHLDDLFLQKGFRDLGKTLVARRNLTIPTFKEASMDELMVIRNVISTCGIENKTEGERFIYFLTDLGYFNFTHPAPDTNSLIVDIPNKELHQYLNKSVYSLFSRVLENY